MQVSRSSSKSLANFLFSLQRAVCICVVVAGVLFSIAPSCADGGVRPIPGHRPAVSSTMTILGA